MNRVAKSVDKEFGDAAYIKWNFTKFLVDRSGQVIARFEPTASMKEVEAAVKAAL
jgi:glutathione peroxidase